MSRPSWDRPQARVDPEPARMLDVAFPIRGQHLAREHRRALADALVHELPWLTEEPDAGVHRLNLSAGGGDDALLSQRTRLTLRVPRERAAGAAALAGRTLQVRDSALSLGGAHARELLPWGTLYAHVVAADGTDDETGFMARLQDELRALDVVCRAICGRRQPLDDGSLHGYGVMLDHLDHRDACRVLDAGLGPHRLWGCGVFVPHKSASAVGAPDWT